MRQLGRPLCRVSGLLALACQSNQSTDTIDLGRRSKLLVQGSLVRDKCTCWFVLVGNTINRLKKQTLGDIWDITLLFNISFAL